MLELNPQVSHGDDVFVGWQTPWFSGKGRKMMAILHPANLRNVQKMCVYIYIWVFPKIVVPPKHPKMIIFSRKTHGCWVPPF